MSEFKGSKGEWVIIEDPDSNGFINVKTEPDYRSTPLRVTIYGDVVVPGNGVSNEARANAILISKAPEMLEMLERIVQSELTPLQIRKECKNLIKSATEL
jgi:hypothetical protein